MATRLGEPQDAGGVTPEAPSPLETAGRDGAGG